MMRKTILVSALLLAACAGPKENLDITKPVTGEAATNAERAYKRGLEEVRDSNFIEATRYFEWVRNNFPYSQYASQAELALADMAFGRDDFAEAAVKYQEFVKSHPSHPKADYAAFRVGLAHFRDKASDWFILPPSYEKDQQPVRDALDALQKFLLSYPKSDYANEAKQLVADCRERLARHERYVADFYWKRGAWKGAAMRLVGIADTYGDLNDGKTRDDALWNASVAFNRAGDPHAERATLERLVQETAANDPHHAEAQKRLAALPKDVPPAAPKEPEPGKLEDAPITPAETPSHPAERPQAAPGPGQVPSDQPAPVAPPADGPAPTKPTTQPPPEPSEPTSQPPAAPVREPGK